MHRWYWKAVYQDGTQITQNDVNPATGRNWSSDSLDLSSLKAIVMEPIGPKAQRVILFIAPDEKPIRFWRHDVVAMGDNVGEKQTCWVIGLEKDGVRYYNFFRPDGSIVISMDPDGNFCDI